jgi:hypothetical protein
MEERRGGQSGGGQMGGEKMGGGGQVRCNQCGQSFGSQNELQDHNRKMHSGGGGKQGGM